LAADIIRGVRHEIRIFSTFVDVKGW